MKISGPLYVLITIAALALVCFLVIFKECKRPPADLSQSRIDSISDQAARREDSLMKIIANAENGEAQAWRASDSFNTKSMQAARLADRYRSDLDKANIQRLLARDAGNDSLACAWGDSVITAAFKTIAAKDSVIHLKDSSINRLSLALVYSERKVTALQGSRDGFKADFMKLKVEVIPPLQMELREANKQWKANRFWKKTFAGGMAAALIYGGIQSIKR